MEEVFIAMEIRSSLLRPEEAFSQPADQAYGAFGGIPDIADVGDDSYQGKANHIAAGAHDIGKVFVKNARINDLRHHLRLHYLAEDVDQYQKRGKYKCFLIWQDEFKI